MKICLINCRDWSKPIRCCSCLSLYTWWALKSRWLLVNSCRGLTSMVTKSAPRILLLSLVIIYQYFRHYAYQFFFSAFFFSIHVISFLLASGVGAGFAVTFEFKKVVNFFIESLIGAGIPQAEEARSAIEKFFDKAYIANGLLLGAFACTAVVSVVSSINRPQSTSSGIFGW